MQRLKELHLEVWQLTGHGPSLQVLEVVRAGQGLPPLAALVRTLRVFLTVPLPQVLVQAVQADQPERAQDLIQRFVRGEIAQRC